MAKNWQETVIDINTWLDRNGIDRTYKKDMKETYEHIKPDLEAQAKATWEARQDKVDEAYEKGRESVLLVIYPFRVKRDKESNGVG